MNYEFVTFVVSAIIVLVGGIGVVASRNPVHSALFLIQTLFGVAILFVVKEAHFLAAVQIVVYAGAIVILFLFVIMLLGVDQAEEWHLKEPIAGQQPLAAIVGAALLGLVVVVTIVATDGLTGQVQSAGERALDNEFTDVERIGRVLFSDYAMSFEITAGLLTIAVIGAVVLTRSVIRDEQLDDLEPASMDLPPVSPYGANDSDLAQLKEGSDPTSQLGDDADAGGSGPDVSGESSEGGE
ncbi:MAG: NADH-quinone oxidoreductase subunit J [Acidimicrobiales bacterium]|nr:NADH-quinone oxidoreductase subunit J [Acidimicrobiales bacterium]